MEISPALAPLQAEEMSQVLILKKAQKIDATEQLALIESVSLTGPTSQPLNGQSVGRVMNEKA